MTDDIKNLLSNFPKKVVGLKQVLRGVIDDTLWCVIVSSDCDDFIKKAVAEQIGAKKIEVRKGPTKQELGSMVGIKVCAAVVGLVK